MQVMRSQCQTSVEKALLKKRQPEEVSLGHNWKQGVTYNHAGDTKKTTAYKSTHVAYSALEDVRPAEFSHNTGSYVPKCDNPFRCRGGHEIESGRKDDHI